MPLPVLVIGGLWLAGTAGVGLGADGLARMKRADRRQKGASARHQRATSAFEESRADAQRYCERYGLHQLRVQRDTLGAWAQWLEKNSQSVRFLQGATIDGVTLELPSLPDLQFHVAEAEQLLAGGVKAAIAAMAARQAALSGVQALATAGTGAAISGLSGAALEGATLAWLGGGTLASGGGGVAAGATVLTGITIAPALLIGGCTLSAQGHKAQTKAQTYVSDVNVSIQRMATAEDLLGQVRRRVAELRQALTRLDLAARKSLRELAAVDFNPDEHAELLLQMAQLMRAVREVLSTPVFAEDGSVASGDVRVTTTYKEAS